MTKRYPPAPEQVRLAYEECERKGRHLLLAVLFIMLQCVVIAALVLERMP